MAQEEKPRWSVMTPTQFVIGAVVAAVIAALSIGASTGAGYDFEKMGEGWGKALAAWLHPKNIDAAVADKANAD
jgi:hypothetical protein